MIGGAIEIMKNEKNIEGLIEGLMNADGAMETLSRLRNFKAGSTNR